jgi:hypothetical protein
MFEKNQLIDEIKAAEGARNAYENDIDALEVALKIARIKLEMVEGTISKLKKEIK